MNYHENPLQTTIMKKGSGVKMKPSGIGGMAVMEGVMMKNKDEYAVAVRKPNNEIAMEKCKHKDFSDKVKLFKFPIFRGILAFIDSMVVGVKVLNFSASFFEEEEDQSKKKKDKSAKNTKHIDADFEIEDVNAQLGDENSKEATQTIEAKEKSGNDSTTIMMIFAVLISIVFSVAIFMVLPVLLTHLVSKVVSSMVVVNLIEGIIRLAIFIGYVMLAALMPEIKRTFMYHGAEHKTINCLENGCELTVENVRRHSKQHKRCGTSFMLLVVLISLVFFMVIPTGNLIWRLLSRVLLVPFIAGVSYEFIRLAGKTENKVVEALSKPGLWMQGLTTKEPDDTMIEVAIKSVDAVFDWRTFLEENFENKKVGSKKKSNTKKSGSAKQSNNPKNPDIDKNEDKIEKVKAEKVKSEKKNNASKKDNTGEKEYAATLETDSIEDKPLTEKQGKIINEKKAIKTESSNKTDVNLDNQKNGNTSDRNRIAPIKSKPSIEEDEEEDDEILRALDKYFDEKKEIKK